MKTTEEQSDGVIKFILFSIVALLIGITTTGYNEDATTWTVKRHEVLYDCNVYTEWQDTNGTTTVPSYPYAEVYQCKLKKYEELKAWCDSRSTDSLSFDDFKMCRDNKAPEKKLMGFKNVCGFPTNLEEHEECFEEIYYE